jgi:hypothetical protein
VTSNIACRLVRRLHALGKPILSLRLRRLSLLAFGTLVSAAVVPAASTAAADLWLEFPGDPAKPGGARHVVLLSGDEEYRSEEALPMLAALLSQRHGFRCTVLFAVDPESGCVDPNNQQSLPGSEAIDSADLLVTALRFRHYPEAASRRVQAALARRVPVVGLRTSTHAFQYPGDSPFAELNQFGKQLLGETWVSHWGRHKAEATRGVIEPAHAEHPVLQGVRDVFGDTDVYEAYPPSDAQILLRGAVLQGMSPDDPPADYAKRRASDGGEQPVNEPMMPIAWTRELPGADGGAAQRVFCTTMGSATDLLSADLRRLVVNAIYWGLELPVPEQADVELVGAYAPTPYGFDGFRRGLRPADLRPAAAQ